MLILERVPVTLEQSFDQQVPADEPEGLVKVKWLSKGSSQTNNQEGEKEEQKNGIPSPGLNRIFI